MKVIGYYYFVCVFVLAASEARINSIMIDIGQEGNPCPQREAEGFVYGRDCNEYVHCKDGRGWHMRCDANLVFDQGHCVAEWQTSRKECKTTPWVQKASAACPPNIKGMFIQRSMMCDM